MSLEAQLQALIDDAPQDGKTPDAIRRIVPILSDIARPLTVLEFYILQNLEQRWQITTLQHQHQPEQTKTVVFAYADLQEATRSQSDVNLIAVPVPVIQLLFQLLTMTPVDSIIFKGQSLSTSGAIEVRRQHLQYLVQQQLNPSATSPPSDIA